jgi:hypothetical protein
MRRTIACLPILLVLLGLLAACGDANTGTAPATQSPSIQAVQPTAVPTLAVAPTGAAGGGSVADPTLPAVVPADPTATSAPEHPTVAVGKPSLIFFTAPG